MNELHIYEPIGEGFARRFQTQLAAFTGKPVTVRVNSPGGSVFEGLTAHQLLKNHGAKVTVCIDGIAASIASVIAMAGSEIRIGPAGMLMIHDASLATRGNARQLTKDAATVEKISDSLAGIYAARTKQPLAKIRELMLSETWLTASQALALGFVDKLEAGLKAAACAWTAKDAPGLPAAALVAAGITTAPPTRRETSAEIDRLRSENMKLRAALSEAALAELNRRVAKPATASKPAPARPLANEAVSSLTKMRRMSCFTAAEKAEAKRELDARGVTVGGKNGNISITSII